MKSERDPDPFVAPDFSWENEEEACKVYLSGGSLLTGAKDEQSNLLQTAVVCLFEYSREVYLQLINAKTTSKEDLLRFRCSAPYSIFVEEWPLKNGDPIPSKPWTKLSARSQERILNSNLKKCDGYSHPVKLEAKTLMQHAGAGTFKQFSDKVQAIAMEWEKDRDEEKRNPSKRFTKKSGPRVSPIIPAHELHGWGEHVIFTIDYRESTERLAAGLKFWVENRRKQIQMRQGKKLKGSTFGDRLRNLAYFRLWRRYGHKEVRDHRQSRRLEDVSRSKRHSVVQRLFCCRAC